MSCLVWRLSPAAFSFESVDKDAEELQSYHGSCGYAEVLIPPRYFSEVTLRSQ